MQDCRLIAALRPFAGPCTPRLGFLCSPLSANCHPHRVPCRGGPQSQTDNRLPSMHPTQGQTPHVLTTWPAVALHMELSWELSYSAPVCQNDVSRASTCPFPQSIHVPETAPRHSRFAVDQSVRKTSEFGPRRRAAHPLVGARRRRQVRDRRELQTRTDLADLADLVP